MCDKNRNSDSMGRELLFFLGGGGKFSISIVYFYGTRCKYTRVNLYIIVLVYTYAFHFILCIKFHVFCMQTEFY